MAQGPGVREGLPVNEATAWGRKATSPTSRSNGTTDARGLIRFVPGDMLSTLLGPYPRGISHHRNCFCLRDSQTLQQKLLITQWSTFSYFTLLHFFVFFFSSFYITLYIKL